MTEQTVVSPTSGRTARIMDNQWAVVQKKTFTKWINNQLKKAKVNPMENITEGPPSPLIASP